MFDADRLAVIMLLVAPGLSVAVVWRARPLARTALALFVVWLMPYFGRAAWGAFCRSAPMHERMLLRRFIGGVDLAAILPVGLCGEWLWERTRPPGFATDGAI